MSTTKRKINTSNGNPAKGNALKKQKVVRDHIRPPVKQQKSKKVDSDDLIESDTTETEEAFEGFEGFESGGSGAKEDASGTKNGLKKPGTMAKRQSGISKPVRVRDSMKAADGASSKETHAKQKAMAQERKAAKPNAAIIQRSKKIWERLRRKSHVPLAERKELVAELFGILSGHVEDFVLKHDAVRVVQTAVKYGNLEQKKMIARELKGNFKSLAESKYAKFLIGKILVHGDEEIRDMIIPEFYGSVRRMIRHPEASWILDDVYRGIATQEQKAILLREWYGPEFALLRHYSDGQTTSNLSDILQQSPEKRTPIMRSLFELINQLIQKKTTGFTMLHDAMLEYFSQLNKGSEEMSEFFELLKDDEEGDLLKNLGFTKSGSRLVCLALAHGTAKDRKHVLRTYKDIIQALAQDTHGYKILLVAYEVIDDTVLCSKTIFPGLLGQEVDSQQEHILSAVANLTARIPYLYLPAGRAKWLLPADDITLLESIDEIRSLTSKKDPIVKRQELLKAISPALLRTVEMQASNLCQTSFGWQFVGEVLLGTVGDKTKGLQAVAELAEGDPQDEGHPAHDAAAARMLKILVLGGHYDSTTNTVKRVDPPLGFHDILYERIKSHAVKWATSPASFVIVGLLEADGFSAKEELLNVLKSHREELERSAKGTAKHQQKQRDQVQNGDTGKQAGKKQEVKAVEPAVKTGTKLLLEKLV